VVVCKVISASDWLSVVVCQVWSRTQSRSPVFHRARDWFLSTGWFKETDL